MNCKNSYKHVQNKDFLYWYMDTLLLVPPLKKLFFNFSKKKYDFQVVALNIAIKIVVFSAPLMALFDFLPKFYEHFR